VLCGLVRIFELGGVGVVVFFVGFFVGGGIVYGLYI